MEELAGGLAYLERVDQNLTIAINALNCPFTDCIWQAFSNKLLWIPFYLLVIVSLVKHLGWRKALILILSCVLTIVACDQIANVFKYGFERLRPCWDEYVTSHESFHLLEKQGGKFGFFSAHAANALGFAVCVSCIIRKERVKAYRLVSWVLVVWALLVGISRIFVGKHFLGDVLVGFAFGSLIGWAMSLLASLIIRIVQNRGAKGICL